jgi:hypothetical protein
MRALRHDRVLALRHHALSHQMGGATPSCAIHHFPKMLGKSDPAPGASVGGTAIAAGVAADCSADSIAPAKTRRLCPISDRTRALSS